MSDSKTDCSDLPAKDAHSGEHILVTTDFSAESFMAFPEARKLISLLGERNTRVSLVTVLEDLVVTSVEFEFGLSLVDPVGMMDLAVKEANDRISKLAVEHFRDIPVDTSVIRATHTVDREIINFALGRGVTLIVMSTHGRTGLRHFLLGSVAEKIIRQAQCPVMVIPSQKKADVRK